LDWIHKKYITAGHPETTIEQLWELAADEVDNVRRRVAENPSSPVELLHTLARDENPEVRMAVAENPNTPGVLLSQLAADEHADVRYSLAENPNLPEEILQKLAEDTNPYVSHRAQRTLRILNPIAPAHLKPARAGEKDSWRQQRRSAP